MVIVVLKALYFFLPSYLANAAPVVLSRFKLFEFLNIRADLGKEINGQPMFGTTKTVRGLLGGIIVAICMVAIQSLLYNVDIFKSISVVQYDMPDVLFLGFLFGFGEGFGDLIKSFIKRRLNIKSSSPSIPLDQSSFLLSLLLSSFYIFPGWDVWIAILILSPLIPLAANIFAYKIGWKNVWW